MYKMECGPFYYYYHYMYAVVLAFDSIYVCIAYLWEICKAHKNIIYFLNICSVVYAPLPSDQLEANPPTNIIHR